MDTFRRKTLLITWTAAAIAIRRKRTWLIAWTGLAIAVGVVARFTFAAPVPSACPPHDQSGLCFDFNARPLWYFVIGLVWLLGLAAIWLIPWHHLQRRRQRRGV